MQIDIIALLMLGLAGIALWIFSSYCQYIIAKKINTKYAWFSWVPGISAIYLLYMAKFQWWLIVIMIVAAILGGFDKHLTILNLVTAIGFIYAYSRICEFRSRPKWWGILFIIPIVNYVMLWYLAFRDVPNQVITVEAEPNNPTL